MPASRLRIGGILVCALMVTTMLSGCFAEPSPMPTVRDFLLAWQLENYADAAKHTDGNQKAVTAELSGVRGQLEAASLNFGLRRIQKTSGSTAVAEFSVQVDLGDSGNLWTYSSQMRLHQVGDGWKIIWAPSIINPYLRPGQRLAIVTESQDRAPIEDAQGHSLLKQTRTEVFGVIPSSLSNIDQTLGALARITTLDKDRLIGRVMSAPPQSFLPLVTIQLPDSTGTAARLSQVDGLESRNVPMPLDPALAPDLVGQLAPATAIRLQQVGAPYQPGDTIGSTGLQAEYQRLLAGTPTVKVVAQDPSGQNRRVVADWQGTPSAPLKTTLARATQAAAERALKNLHVPASLVAVDAPTGEITGLANHLTNGENRAMVGHYPPGMTFSMISSQAMLVTGLLPTAPLPCPATQAVGDQVFRNVGAGGKTFKVNFAKGCATAFVSQVSSLTNKDLPESAARFGIGVPWGLPVAAFSGSVPAPVSESDRASAMIGQGNVSVSPLAMALAAATIDTGTWRPPQLLTNSAANSVQPQNLDPNSIHGLQTLMQAAVAKGGVHAADLAGTQITGGVSATVTLATGKTISWFVGYKGGTAFALTVEGKVDAAKIAAAFLRA
jgi:Penicillin binding protein transpeptidase domain/NTF2-like N-terminal transpeptidase domain